MMRLLRLIALALPALAMGCQNLSPAIEGPTLPGASSAVQDQNPVYIPLPKRDYGKVTEGLLQVLHDYGFEIADSNRYSGHIETVPRVAPGVLLLFKPGSPDFYDRVLATLQTYRHRVTIVIQPADPNGADHGGYFVEFIVRKELESLPRPLQSSLGQAVFRSENTVERQTEVIDATIFDPMWIYRGRDVPLEQELIRRFKCVLSKT